MNRRCALKISGHAQYTLKGQPTQGSRRVRDLTVVSQVQPSVCSIEAVSQLDRGTNSALVLGQGCSDLARLSEAFLYICILYLLH